LQRITSMHVAVALLAILGAVPLSRMLELPAMVDGVTVENPTDYDLAVEVDGTDGDGRLILGTARRGGTMRAEEVLDRGAVWTFRFTGQGYTAGELRIERGELEAAGWTVAIPEEVGARLRAEGAVPSP
jgi:hypothetical protein